MNNVAFPSVLLVCRYCPDVFLYSLQITVGFNVFYEVHIRVPHMYIIIILICYLLVTFYMSLKYFTHTNVNKTHLEMRASYIFLGALGVVPQSDLSSTIIVSTDYNDLNFFL